MLRNEVILFAEKWMEMEIIMLNEINQILKDTHHVECRKKEKKCKLKGYCQGRGKGQCGVRRIGEGNGRGKYDQYMLYS
jgi:hypothetical protein